MFKNNPAFAVLNVDLEKLKNSVDPRKYFGLTKRELFAKDIMVEMLSNCESGIRDNPQHQANKVYVDNLIRDSIYLADKLLDKLEETKETANEP